MLDVQIVSLKDDLSALVTEINSANWDDDNEISEYSKEALLAYLQRADTIFLTCYETLQTESVLLGIASARIEMKPYGKELWLYVDEVDVCADQRRKGTGKLLMQRLIAIAEAEGCEELWLGAESDNYAANALYRSLNPDEVSSVTGYTYETDE